MYGIGRLVEDGVSEDKGEGRKGPQRMLGCDTSSDMASEIAPRNFTMKFPRNPSEGSHNTLESESFVLRFAKFFHACRTIGFLFLMRSAQQR